MQEIMGHMTRPPRHSASEICRLIALHPEPVVAVSDIVNKLEMTDRGLQTRLKSLEEDGYLESKKVGSSGLVFWLTDEGRKSLNKEF